MRVRVGPAKREGVSRTIFHRPLSEGDVASGTSGAVTLSIDAGGIYADSCMYQYSIDFTLDELLALVDAGRLKDARADLSA